MSCVFLCLSAGSSDSAVQELAHGCDRDERGKTWSLSTFNCVHIQWGDVLRTLTSLTKSTELWESILKQNTTDNFESIMFCLSTFWTINTLHKIRPIFGSWVLHSSTVTFLSSAVYSHCVVSSSSDQSRVLHEVYKSGPELEEDAFQKTERGVWSQNQRCDKVCLYVIGPKIGSTDFFFLFLWFSCQQICKTHHEGSNTCLQRPQARALQSALHSPPVHWGSGEEGNWRSGNLQDLRGGHWYPGPQSSIRHQ